MPSTAFSLQPSDVEAVLIGFGEAGQAFAKGWRAEGVSLIAAYDIKTLSDDPAVRVGKLDDYEAAGVSGRDSLAAALTGARFVVSAVTADQARTAAEAAAKHMAPGAVYLDCNSCAPSTKQGSALIIEAAGARYVDVAVMAPVHPRLHKTPMLVSGPHAADASAAMAARGMAPRIVEGGVGAASSIKMIRSVMIKGLEALTIECVLSAVTAGVDGEVLASLDASFPGFDWTAKSAYMLERAATHGVRRAAEMREVALTIDDLGLSGHMSRATALRQDEIGQLGVRAYDNEDYAALARRLLDALAAKGSER
jgi:3-hydroxyisobutyrate dehydrogenase-like beta-hydroxyacid dehydrogenase